MRNNRNQLQTGNTILITLLMTALLAVAGAACAQDPAGTPANNPRPTGTAAAAATGTVPSTATGTVPSAATGTAPVQPTERPGTAVPRTETPEEPEPTRETGGSDGLPPPPPTHTPQAEPTTAAMSTRPAPTRILRDETSPALEGKETGTDTEDEGETITRHTAEASGSRPPPDGRRPPQRPPGVPKAGEIDDNQQWNQYLDFIHTYAGPPALETPVRERYIVTVQDGNGRPVRNATVTFRENGLDLQTSLTYADGRTIFHHLGPAGDGRISVSASRGSSLVSGNIERSPDGGETKLIMDRTGHRQGRVRLDVLFLLDSTGSMADEIARIKATLTSIAKQVQSLPANPSLRMGMVSYRDRGDEYVTKLYDFDADPRRFAQTVRGVRAAGGDDYPESLNEALHAAVRKPSWRQDSIKLIFLIADAPPHLDYPQDFRYDEEMAQARQDGKKIFAVASSGLDNQGEYVFRQLAQQTMGKFIFILYSSGPQRELTTPHEVGDDYSVENLDRLIVRLITGELQHAGAQ